MQTGTPSNAQTGNGEAGEFRTITRLTSPSEKTRLSPKSPHCARRPGLTEPLSPNECGKRHYPSNLGDVRPSPVSAQDRPRGSPPDAPPEAASGTIPAISLSPPPNTLLREPIGEKIHLGAQSRGEPVCGRPRPGTTPSGADSRGQPWSAGAKGDQGATSALWSREFKGRLLLGCQPRRPRSRGLPLVP